MAILITLIAIVAVSLVVCLVLLVLVTSRGLPARSLERADRDHREDRGGARRSGRSLVERNLARGARGEAEVGRYQLRSLPAGDYRAYESLYIPRVDGKGTTEIDHVVVSRYGVFVIETKSWKGRVDGSADDDRWTQQVRSKVHHKDNPLKQNRLHTRSISAFLDVPDRSVHSVVCLHGRGVSLGDGLPANVVRADDLARYIRSFQREILSEAGIGRLNRILTEHVDSSDAELDRAIHLRGIRRRLRGDDWP